MIAVTHSQSWWVCDAKPMVCIQRQEPETTQQTTKQWKNEQLKNEQRTHLKQWKLEPENNQFSKSVRTPVVTLSKIT